MSIDKKLRNLLQSSRDAVVCVADNHIQFANSSAVGLFGGDITGQFALRHVPEHLLGKSADGFVSHADILGRSCTVSVSHWQKVLVLTFYPETSERRKTEFVSDGLLASMNAALCNISIALQSLKRLGSKDDECLCSASSIYHAYYMFKHLVGNLSAAIAFDEGTAVCLRSSVDLAKLCSDAVSTAAVALGDRVKLSFSTDCGELVANVSSDLIERMILNLLSNSAMRIPPDGHITLGLKLVSDKAVISVDDNGPGIPPRILRHIFRAYELAIGPDTLGDMYGSGLGLGICRRIAEIHGGSMIIESREGVGTSVRVLLPLGSDCFAEPSPPHVPSMDNILTEFAFLLNYTDYKQLLE